MTQSVPGPSARRSWPGFFIDDADTDEGDEQRTSGEFFSGRMLAWQPTVAVAEDDEDMRSLLVTELRRDGYAVHELASGDALMSYLRDAMDPHQQVAAPDLIVTDLRMPGWSGMDVLDFLHEVQWPIPVVLITAFGDRPTHAMASALGAVCTLDKPFRISDLKSTIYLALVGDEHLTSPPGNGGRGG